MQSQQEQFVRQLSEHSMGSAFVFEPDEYSKGNARREIADLVWANNSVIILMAMKAGKADAASKRTRSLKQLRGGLRAWRDLGIPLKGEIDGASINFAFDPACSVVLLTVEDGEDAELIRHSTILDRGTIILTASIPESVLFELARRGGSSRDLIELLLSVAALPINLDGAIELLLAQHQHAWFESVLNLIPGFYDDGAFHYFTNFVINLRRQLRPLTSIRTMFHGQAHDFVGTLDDTGWTGLFRLLSALWSPDDPGPSQLWLPRVITGEEYHNGVRDSALFMKTLPGIDFVMVSTVTDGPTPDVSPWPRIRTHAITYRRLGRHTLLVARVPGVLSGPWQHDWTLAWNEALANADPEFPPLGLISWESTIGHGMLLVGQQVMRGSETAELLRGAVI